MVGAAIRFADHRSANHATAEIRRLTETALEDLAVRHHQAIVLMAASVWADGLVREIVAHFGGELVSQGVLVDAIEPEGPLVVIEVPADHALRQRVDRLLYRAVRTIERIDHLRWTAERTTILILEARLSLSRSVPGMSLELVDPRAAGGKVQLWRLTERAA